MLYLGCGLGDNDTQLLSVGTRAYQLWCRRPLLSVPPGPAKTGVSCREVQVVPMSVQGLPVQSEPSLSPHC